MTNVLMLLTVESYSGMWSKLRINIMKIGLTTKSYDMQFKCFIVEMTLVLKLLEYVHYNYQRLILSGDVELNPGPLDMSVCHINCRGLSTAKMLAIKHDIQTKYNIITLSETFLSKNSSQDLSLNGYHEIIRKDRDTFGGGVAVYVCNSLAYKRRFDLELNHLECVWLEVKQKTSKFLIATIYRPPNSDNAFWDELQFMYDHAISLSPLPIFITGDLNAHPGTPNGILLNEFSNNNFLTIHVDEPTRITEDSATILDQFISNVPNLVKDVTVHPPLSTNDHCTISITINLKVSNLSNYTRHLWNYKNADFIGLNEAILNYDWEPCFQGDDINETLGKWTTSFLNLARQYIPNKVITIRSRDSPWFSGELRKLLRKKNKLHRTAKQYNSPENSTLR